MSNELSKETALAPGDGGPCSICGQDMKGKAYPLDYDLFGDSRAVSGRYWHMKEEHGIIETYPHAYLRK